MSTTPKRRTERAAYTCTSPVIVAGKWSTTTSIESVRVMARAEGYAMVRKTGCMPFVVREKELAPEATT